MEAGASVVGEGISNVDLIYGTNSMIGILGEVAVSGGLGAVGPFFGRVV